MTDYRPSDTFLPNLVTADAESILIVDDDPQIRELVTLKLEQSGYNVLSAAAADHALSLIAKRGLPHLALVDIHMPGRTGLDFCEEVLSYSDLPIIMLTADGDLSTIIDAIEYYAEDYVVKPFNLNELLVRIRRVLRRMNDTGYAMTPVQRIDDHLSINIGAQRLQIDGQEKRLTPIESKLLHILVQHRRNAVRTEYLLKRVWPHDEVYEDALRVHIHRLRKKLIASDHTHQYIVTERGIGYRFTT